MRKHRAWKCQKCSEVQYKVVKSWVDSDLVIRQLVCLNCKAHIFTKEVAMEKNEYFWKTVSPATPSRPFVKRLKCVE